MYIKLTIKSIHLGDLSTLVIASEKCNFIRIFGFQGKKLCECFQAIVATINKVSLNRHTV